MSSDVVITCQADEAPPQEVRRNFRLGVMNGVLYIIGEALLDPTLVLVAFVSQLSPLALFVGLVLPLRDSLWAIPQLWMSGYVQSLPRKIVLCRRVTVVRIISWACLALEINFISDLHLLLIAFFITFSISSFASGVNGLAFMEVVSKTIPSRRRGEFFAWRLGISGVINIGSSLLVRWLLSPQSPLSFPHNFGLLSILYMIFASAGLICFNMINEPADEEVLPVQSMQVLLKRALEFLKQDVVYRNFMVLLSVMEVAAMATPFFAVYVQQILGGDPSMVGVYLGITIVSNLASNLVFGRVSIRYGNRLVMLFSAAAGTLMSAGVLLLVLLAEPLKISAAAASIWLMPVFVFVGIRATGYTISSSSIMLDIAPLSDRSLYVGFLNTLTGLVLLATGFSGVLKDLIGIKFLITITLAAHLLALYLTLNIRIKRSAR